MTRCPTRRGTSTERERETGSERTRTVLADPCMLRTAPKRPRNRALVLLTLHRKHAYEAEPDEGPRSRTLRGLRDPSVPREAWGRAFRVPPAGRGALAGAGVLANSERVEFFKGSVTYASQEERAGHAKAPPLWGDIGGQLPGRRARGDTKARGRLGLCCRSRLAVSPAGEALPGAAGCGSAWKTKFRC